MKYPRRSRKMQSISLKLPEDLEQLLDKLARERSLPRSAILREALRAYAANAGTSATAVAGDLVGSLEGPRDLSTAARHMTGFGE
jgi:Ribbon-helix-helix protein, copG family.